VKIITNKDGEVNLPYDPELLEWLQITYPFSKYHVLELQ
jgi:hypothetical protein